MSVLAKRPLLRIRNLLVPGLCALALSVRPSVARDQSAGATAHPASTELEAILFVQSPQPDNGKGAIHLVWVPQPIEQLLLGKTAQQCSAIDSCVRTTNASTCRNLGIPLSRLPSYPDDMRPRRQLSVIYFAATPVKNLAMLQDFYHRAPRSSLERLSLSVRVKARVRFTRRPEESMSSRSSQSPPSDSPAAPVVSEDMGRSAFLSFRAM
jgi:hypothetical protein